jgi:hypothetical protein
LASLEFAAGAIILHGIGQQYHKRIFQGLDYKSSSDLLLFLWNELNKRRVAASHCSHHVQSFDYRAIVRMVLG